MDLDLEQQLREALHEDTELAVPAGLAQRALESNGRRRVRRLTGAMASAVAVVLAIGAVGLTERVRSDGGGTFDTPNERVSTAPPAFEQPVRQEADRLLSLAILPAGSTTTSERPTRLDGPVSEPVSDDLVHTSSRFYVVPLSVAAARSFLMRHVPTGLSPGDTAEAGGGTGATVYGVQLTAPDTRSYEQATLSYSLISAGPTRSIVQVEAFALGVDPVPLSANIGGAAVRIAVAGGCPDLGAGYHVANPGRSGLSSTLLPAGDPTAALLCRYAGTGLTRSPAAASLTADAAGSLARDIRGSDLGHTDGRRSCPSDDGSAVLLAFAYPARPDVDIDVAVSGCGSIDNGIIQGTPSLALLKALGTG